MSAGGTAPRRRRAGSGLVARALAASIALCACAPTARAAAPELEGVYDQFASLRPDSTRVVDVTSLPLERDAGVIVLEEGRLTLCQPVGNRVVAAIFEGHGVFAFTPSTAVERGQLERNYGVTMQRRPFTAALFVFADSTLDELTAGRTFHAGVPAAAALKLLRSTVRTLTFEKARDVDGTIARSLLEERLDGTFFAAFATTGTDLVGFQIAPQFAEPVLLLRSFRPQGSGLMDPERLEIVCQSRRGDDTTSVVAGDFRPSVTIGHLTLDCTVTGKPAFSVRASLDFDALETGQRWLPLDLDPELRVESAEWGDGRPAGFRKGEKSPTLWIRCDPPLEAGQHYTLKLRYDGPVLEREGDWFRFRTIPSSTAWYPSHGSKRATFDLTFHVADPLELVCVGERVSKETRDRVTTTRWVTPSPVRRASFNVGFFKSFEVHDERIPPVTVLMSSRGHGALTDSLAKEGEAPGRDMEKQVAADVANSLLFFQRRFGPAGVDRFCATELLGLHGQAFPGLIHLSTVTFHSPRPGSADALFRAHEVAHQWWGVGVAPASYRDQWLSEGFAEFSALLYVQFSTHDSGRYLERLEDMRRRILGNRRYVMGSGQRAGPICLGTRNATSSTAGDVGVIVYEKGAWVLHMLRNLLLDLETRDETRFFALLRDYYQTYRGRDASTADFQKLAESTSGQDLGWFFDQWVCGTDTPAYRFAWRSERTSDTTWAVHGRVEQRGVPDGFRMPVPIRIEFAGERLTRARVLIQGPRTDFDLPGLPLEPKKVVFNDMASVLCEVENVKW